VLDAQQMKHLFMRKLMFFMRKQLCFYGLISYFAQIIASAISKKSCAPDKNGYH